MNVIKRDKTTEVFRFEKVKNAVLKAFEACNKEAPDELFDVLYALFPTTSDKTMSVEEIQDEIENTLINRFPDVAKKFIIYRYNHKVIRENKDKLIKGLSKKLMAKDVENQNANVDEYSFGGRIGEASRIITKDYALNYCMSRKSRKNHLENEIYIHKLKIVA